MSKPSTHKPFNVLILHAYSPLNSGDGLLVNLARSAVESALGECTFKVIASNSAAFADQGYIQWLAPGFDAGNESFRRAGMFATALLGPKSPIKHLAKSADLIVAVGGGYMRGRNFAASIKSLGAHYGQLALAAKYGSKSIYLPQSIGPFGRFYKPMISSKLNQVSTVLMRDDRSVEEFASLTNTLRVPDMAVLELAREFGTRTPPDFSQKPVMIARDLDRPRGYYDFLKSVSKSHRFEWAVQSQGGGNDDMPLTTQMSRETPRLMQQVLSENRPRVVVSTRLHGALSALIAGYPAIHLSYERKGWGAFEDLGLGEFVLNARDAKLEKVDSLIEKIVSDPSSYWQRIEKNTSAIRASESLLFEIIRQRVRQRD